MWSSLFLLSLLGSVSGQLDAGTPGINVGDSVFHGSRICNGTFSQANATGVASFNPDIGTHGGDLQWAATVYQTPNTTANTSLTELSLWFSPGPANYSDNAALGFDACYLWISEATYNTWERGQNDTGGCVQTLDDSCVNDLNAATRQFALWLTGTPSDNLTANSLPGVCQTLGQQVTDNFPTSCKPFFNAGVQVFGSPPALGGPLTGNNSFVARAQCTVEDDSTDTTFALMWSQFGDAAIGTYEVATYFVTPVITAFFPIANEARPVTIAYTKSFMTCVRANVIKKGSMPVPNAPLPTPINTSAGTTSNSSSNATDILGPSGSSTADPNLTSNNTNNDGGLSGGAIAGIAVGVIIGVIALIGLLALFVFRKRIQEKLSKRKSGKQFAEMDTATGYAEMAAKPQSPVIEAPNSAISEMPGGAEARRAELGGTEKMQPVELPAHRPSHSSKS